MLTRIAHAATITNLTAIATRNHNDLQNRDVTDAHPPESVGVFSQISQKLLTATKQTVSLFNKVTPQLQVVGTTIYYVWSGATQIWTAASNLDGSGFTATQQTVSLFNKQTPQLQVVGTTIYYVWSEQDGAGATQIWTAASNLDGSGFTATQQTVSAFSKIAPQLQVAGTTIYYAFQETDGANYQIWTATSNLDGSGFTATNQTTSAFNKTDTQLKVLGNTIYYLWHENDGANEQIWTATSNLDGSGFTATNQTTSAFDKRNPQLQVVGTTIYYVWRETDGAALTQIWTATSNLDGSGFTVTKQTTSAFDKRNPQLQVVGTTIYYVWSEQDVANEQIWTATSLLVFISSYFPRRWLDVTAVRAVNTTYTNNDSRTMHVVATIRCAITLGGGNAYAQGKSDDSDPSTTASSGIVGIEAGLLNEDNTFELSFYVMPGKKYRIDKSETNGTVTLGNWFETFI